MTIRGEILEQPSVCMKNLYPTFAATEKKLQQAKEQLDMAGHELGTPLTLMSGYLDLFWEEHETPLADEHHHLFEMLINCINHMVLIVNSIHDVIYADSGKLHLSLRPIELTDQIQRAIAEFQPLLSKHQQIIQINCRSSIPAVLCDLTRLKQILQNFTFW
ncbi:hypothetical protein KFU94_32995 [Chloroflexi bacterium TSY]|nr:hypothetical protein [Chloroflexi bacterium TSY]